MLNSLSEYVYAVLGKVGQPADQFGSYVVTVPKYAEVVVVSHTGVVVVHRAQVDQPRVESGAGLVQENPQKSSELVDVAQHHAALGCRLHQAEFVELPFILDVEAAQDGLVDGQQTFNSYDALCFVVVWLLLFVSVLEFSFELNLCFVQTRPYNF